MKDRLLKEKDVIQIAYQLPYIVNSAFIEAVRQVPTAGLQDEYLTVLNDLMKCGLFVGRYDARNGNRHFMRGICTVMEFIAIQAGVENLTDVFYDNMQKSEYKTAILVKDAGEGDKVDEEVKG